VPAIFYRAVPTSGEAATRCLVTLTPAPHRLQSHRGPFRPLTMSPVARRRRERVKNLQEQLHEAVGQLDHLRDEAANLAADLRNDLHRLILERQAVERLDAVRRERIEHRARSETQQPECR
jgi:hypothetical protein